MKVDEVKQQENERMGKEAYAEGRQAAKDGNSLDDNPYRRSVSTIMKMCQWSGGFWDYITENGSE